MKDNAKRARRRKTAWVIVALLLVFLVGRFFYMRGVDRHAWPTPAPGVAYDPAGGRGDRWAACATPESFAAVLDGLQQPDQDLVAEYHAYQAAGIESGAAYPLIDARLKEFEKTRTAFAEVLGSVEGLDPSAGSVAYNTVAGLNNEITLLGCYVAADLLRQNPTNAAAAEIRYNLLRQSLKLTLGGGMIGRAAALNSAMLVVREQIMAPVAWSNRTDCVAQIARLRALEQQVGDVDAALFADWVSIRQSIVAMYAQMAGTNAPNAKPDRRASMIYRLGGTEAVTQANLDALFSRLVHNAVGPYAPDGLLVGLPEWCRGTSRPPWTRDPVGAAVASAYLKTAALGYVAGPGLLLELRVARIDTALQWVRQTTGAFPDSLDALLATGLLEAGDLVDPFAKDAATRLVYARDGDGWRLHSVGIDQEDGGGLVDAYRSAGSRQKRGASDFVFISRERETRLAAQPAAKPAAQPAAAPPSASEEGGN
ncbi:MAG: hypothetical protein ACOX9C_07795 [Kiritimatiellia bacterium]